VSIASEYTLVVDNIELADTGSLTIGILRIDGSDGDVYLNDVLDFTM